MENDLWNDCGGAMIMGPMVRASSLPLRLAALDYGADLVFSEESEFLCLLVSSLHHALPQVSSSLEGS